MPTYTYIMLGVVLVLFIGMFIFSSRRNKKRQQEAQDLMDAVKPGNKVKTIGGICGIVVEVDNEENTFVLETGSEDTGKSYMKFDKQAIYQTDAVVSKDENKQEKKEEAEETDGENAQSAETVAEPFEEVKAEEPASTEEKKEEKKNKKDKKEKKAKE